MTVEMTMSATDPNHTLNDGTRCVHPLPLPPLGLMMMLMTLRDDDDDAPMTDDVTMFYDVLGLRTIQNRDSEGGKRYAATTPIKDDAEGHLIYKPGDVINGRCTKYVVMLPKHPKLKKSTHCWSCFEDKTQLSVEEAMRK